MPQIDLTNFFSIVEVLFYSLLIVYVIFVLYLSPVFYNMLKSNFCYTLNSINFFFDGIDEASIFDGEEIEEVIDLTINTHH